MHLTLVTSLDGLSRNSAVFSLADRSDATPVVLHDLLDGGVVIRRVHVGDRLIQRESMVLEHGCLSCTVRLDLVPALQRLAEDGYMHAVVGLPPGTSAENAIDGLRAVAPQAFIIDTVALALRAEDVEDQLWDSHTLVESGYTAIPEDSRTPGEFLIGEFLFADTVLATTSELLPNHPNLCTRGLQLMSELAPHSILVQVPDPTQENTGPLGVLGVHDGAAARARSLPGTVLTPATSSESFRTVEHRVDRPLHPGRFRTALGAISQGCCFVRGEVWIAGIETRIAVHGVGPHIGLGDSGAWGKDSLHGPRCPGTHLALTGDDLDDEDITNLLDACALTDEELHSTLAHVKGKNSPSTTYTTSTEGAS